MGFDSCHGTDNFRTRVQERNGKLQPRCILFLDLERGKPVKNAL